MINRLMRKWKGYVTFRIRGHDVGGAVSAIIHQRVQRWNVRKQDGEVLVDC